MLILYNAIEASVRDGIQAIYDELDQKRIPYENLKSTFRKRVLKDFKRHASQDRDYNMANVAVDLINRSFKADKLFSGNVDARIIRDHAEQFGISLNLEFSETKNGADLVKIKYQRNNLAHGVTTFSEVGKEYTLSEIEEIEKHSMAYLNAVLLSIDSYLSNQEYLEPVHAA